MSSLNVSVCRIDEVRPHSNADRLEIAVIGGWECAVAKGKFHKGDSVVYIPPDTCIPPSVSDPLGVTTYLGKNGRIVPTRLRGEVSMGLVLPIPDDQRWEVGTDVAQYFGATKYEPPLRHERGGLNGRGAQGEVSRANTEGFSRYTDLENLRHHAGAFHEGERVVAVEKLHGSNVRIGVIDGRWHAGSRKLERKMPAWVEDELLTFWNSPLRYLKRAWSRLWSWGQSDGSEAASQFSQFWLPFAQPGVREMLGFFAPMHDSAVLYGEIFGTGIQTMTYGQSAPTFAAFDLCLDGEFVDYEYLERMCLRYNVPMAPRVAMLPYSLAAIKELSEGESLVAGAGHLREGVVVRPLREGRDTRGNRRIYKYVADSYLLSKKSDYTEA